MSSKNLILLRGIPGSGKTTMAKLISRNYTTDQICADEFFDRFHGGEFIPSRIKEAHAWCQDIVHQWMKADMREHTIVVHNTFTEEWEMEAYFDMAKEWGYNVHTLIVENRHGSTSVHNVPEQTITKMRGRFNISL